jgi:DNA-binding NtrC family response regulator
MLSKIDEIERQMIIDELRKSRGSGQKAALALRIPKSTLHDRAKSYGININDFKVSRPRQVVWGDFSPQMIGKGAP